MQFDYGVMFVCRMPNAYKKFKDDDSTQVTTTSKNQSVYSCDNPIYCDADSVELQLPNPSDASLPDYNQFASNISLQQSKYASNISLEQNKHASEESAKQNKLAIDAMPEHTSYHSFQVNSVSGIACKIFTS